MILFEGFVAEESVAATQVKVAKAAKRSLKIGMPTPRLVITNETGEEKVAREPGTPSWLPQPTVRTRLIRIEAEGDLRINGWRFAAINEPISATESLIVRVPGFEGEVPEAFRRADPDRCDQCQKRRVRAQSFIVTNDEGEFRQVGRNCLADFLGHDPKSLIEMLAIWGDLAEENDGGRSSAASFYAFTDVLAVAARVVTAFGWVGRAKAEEQNLTATADWTRALLTGSKLSPEDRADLQAVSSTTVDALAADTQEAAAAISSSASDWAYDVSLLARANNVPSKRVGLAASAVILGIRLQERRAAAASAGASHFVGKPGEKIEAPVKVTLIKAIDGRYGPSFIVKMSGNGADFLWFASAKPTIEVGAEAILKGTIKAHQEDKFSGQPVTVVTRCALA